jgi:PAS domain S-box-containing protein
MIGFIEHASVETVAPPVELSAGDRARDRRAGALFDAMDDAVLVHDLDGRILDVNPAACRRLRYTRDELLRLTMVAIATPEFAADFHRRLPELLAAGQLTCDGRHVAKDGQVIAVEINSSAIQIDGTSAILAVVRDVGHRHLERQRVEEALRQSEAFYHSLVESLPQHIIRKDKAGRFTFVNQRVCNILQRPLEKIVGKTDFDLFPPELASKYRADDLHVLETGAILDTVEEHHLPDGRKLHVQILKTPIYDSSSQLIGTQVIFWDVTDHHRWEQALSESERRYRQLTEASQDAIVVADARGRITLFNPAAERTFGYEPAEVLGQSLEILVPPEHQERHRQGFARYLATRQPHVIGRPIELTGRRKDGSGFPLELSLSAIDLGGEVQFLGAIRDTTERNRLRTSVIQNEKLVSIGLLSAGIAHEINNPLAYVANNLAVLERDVGGLIALLTLYESARADLARANPAVSRKTQALAEAMDLPYVRENFDRVLARTREGVQRVTRIVHSLRGLAQTDAPTMEEAHLPDLVDTALDMVLGRLKQRGIKVECDYGPTQVRCVPSQLSQVFLNLLVNALQAIEGRPGGGVIHIASRQVGAELLVEVADDGCGIDPQHVLRLFDPFFTTKPVGEGTGLGLSITHGIVAGHGGRIEVESRLGEGSRFRIFLPRAAAVET